MVALAATCRRFGARRKHRPVSLAPVAAPVVEVAEWAGVGLDGFERPTEDRVVRLPHAVVVADGATSLRDDELSGGWYAEHLCAALADRLTRHPRGDLKDLLADAIDRARRRARPGARRGAVQHGGRAALGATTWWTRLVLADSPSSCSPTSARTCWPTTGWPRGRRNPGGYRQRLREGGGYGPEHAAALRASGARHQQTAQRRRRFLGRGGRSGRRGHTRTPAAGRATHVTAALMATDGMSCGVDDYHIFDWPQVLAHADGDGPAAVLAMVRAAEVTDPDGVRWPRPKRHDDKTLVLVRSDPSAFDDPLGRCRRPPSWIIL